MGLLSWWRKGKPKTEVRVLVDPRRLGISKAREMMDSLQPPDRLSAGTAEAMLVHPTIANGARNRVSVILSSDYHAQCDDEDWRVLTQQVLDRVLPEIFPYALLSLFYGEAAVQIAWEQEDLEIRTAKPSGERTTRFPDAFVPGSFRGLEPESWWALADDRGDFAGLRYLGQDLPPSLVALFVHQRLWERFSGRSCLLPDWRPWQLEFRIFDDFALYSENQASPALKARGPDGKEWLQYAQGDTSKTTITNPLEWIRDVAANVHSNGGMVLPSAKRIGLNGADLGYLFDVEQLHTQARGAEYEKILLYLRLLMIEGMFGSVEAGQAASKQAARGFYTRMLPDQIEVIGQIHDQIVRPVVELAAGEKGRKKKVPKTWIEPGLPAENRNELLFELLKHFKDLRVRLENGEEVLLRDAFDGMRAFSMLSLPVLDADRAPRAPKAPDPTALPGPEGRPRTEPGNKSFDSDDPESEQRG